MLVASKNLEPYLFQYEERHLNDQSVAACMRFLCHGLVFQTVEGRTVTLTPHALRHVFATHIHQVEGVPLDVVAVMLHQKNVHVTAYYAAPPWQQILATANSLLNRFATHLGSVEEPFACASRTTTPVGGGQAAGRDVNQGAGWAVYVPCHLSDFFLLRLGVSTRFLTLIARTRSLNRTMGFHPVGAGKAARAKNEVVKMQALLGRCETEREEMRLIQDFTGKMNSMSHNSPLNETPQTTTTRPWLKKYHEARRQRTIDLVKATVDRCLPMGRRSRLKLSVPVRPRSTGRPWCQESRNYWE